MKQSKINNILSELDVYIQIVTDNGVWIDSWAGCFDDGRLNGYIRKSYLTEFERRTAIQYRFKFKPK